MTRRRKNAVVPPTGPVTAAMSDLFVLAADKNIEQTVLTLLRERTHSLNIRAITVEKAVHPHHDPGCVRDAHEFLNLYRSSCTHALVVFDREGCGRESMSREEIEADIESRLVGHWAGRAAAIVIDPELENWIWSRSPHVSVALGWPDSGGSLPDWLVENGYFTEPSQVKPPRPKEALEAVLSLTKTPRSSSIYARLAGKVSLEQCSDPAFIKLRTLLRTWFSAP